MHITKYKIGDIVRVVKKSDEFDSWIDIMDRRINTTGIVISFETKDMNKYAFVLFKISPELSILSYYFEDASLEIELDPEEINRYN